MLRLMTSRGLALLVVFAFTTYLLLAPASAEAEWVDHSDELPGYDFPTELVIIGAVLVAVLVVVLIVKSASHDDAPSPTDKEDNKSPSDSLDTAPSETGREKGDQVLVGSVTRKLSAGGLGVYLDIDRTNNGPITLEMTQVKLNGTVKFGLAFRF